MGESAAYAPPPDWAWSHSQNMPGDDVPYKNMRSLTFPANLLYHSVHLTLQHSMADSRLIWYYDVLRLLQQGKNSQDWFRLLDEAEKLNWGASLSAVLNGVENIFGYSLPPEFKHELRSTGSQAGANFQRRNSKMTRTEAGLNRFSSRKAAYKLKYILVRLFPSPTHMRNRYCPNPEWIWPLYYFYRWGDIFYDVIRTMGQKI